MQRAWVPSWLRTEVLTYHMSMAKNKQAKEITKKDGLYWSAIIRPQRQDFYGWGGYCSLDYLC